MNDVDNNVFIISPPPASATAISPTTAVEKAYSPPLPPTPTTTAVAATTKSNASTNTNDEETAEAAAAAEATATLLKSLRESRAELGLAISAKFQADKRCAIAQRAYDRCVHLLAGYHHVAPMTMTGRKKKKYHSDDDDIIISGTEVEDSVIRRDSEVGVNNNKRFKASIILPTSGITLIERSPMTAADAVVAAAAAGADLLLPTTMTTTMKDDPSKSFSTAEVATAAVADTSTAPSKSEPAQREQQQQQRISMTILAETGKTSHIANTTATLPPPSPGQQLLIPTNPLHHPPNYNDIITTSALSIGIGNIMSPSTLQSFRNAFYHTLTKGAVSDADVDLHTWQPSPNNANLKSHSQLQEWIHVVQNWNTGADGMDVGAFRAKYKTFYSRMKPASCNLGRRTGMHLRKKNNDDEEEGAGGLGGGGGSGEKGTSSSSSFVLCRHNKAGNKSIMYLDVCRLFDALFEIHVVELSHRGRDATKNLADERYANIPDGTVRAFLDNCPICNARRSSRGGGRGSSFVDEELVIDYEEEEEDVGHDDVNFASKTHNMGLQSIGESTSLQGV